MTNKTKGFIYGAIAAASYGMNPLFALPLYAAGMSVDTVLFYRYFFATIVLGILMKMQHQSFALHKADVLPLVIMGLLFSFSSLLLFMSYNYMDAGIASTILFVYPVMVAVIMGIFFKEKISAITVFSILLALSGIALLYQGDGNKPLSTLGIIFVLLSSLSYAIYIVGVNRSTLKNLPTTKLTFYAILFGLSVYIVRLNFCTELQSNTVCLALGRCTITRHPANCRITGLYRTGHPLYRLYTNGNIGCSGTSDSFILRCSPVSRKTDSPLNDGYFNDYHRRYPDYHWQVTHKKDGYAVADEQKIIYFCYLINQNAILNLKKYGRRKDLP